MAYNGLLISEGRGCDFMKNLFRNLICISATVSIGCAHSFDEFSFEKRIAIEKPEAVVFAVKIGGPIYCGAHQLLINEFNNEEELSCLNDKVNERLARFNATNQKDVFLVVVSIKGSLSNGETFKAKNESGMTLVYGDKYLVFLNSHQEDLVFSKCTVFESYFYENILKTENDRLSFETIKNFVMKNNSLCKYE